MRHIDIFTGIGGWPLACSWVFKNDYKPVMFCEKELFCQAVLKKHWPDVPIANDVFEMKGSDYECDILTASPPCQPFSCAGKQRGKADDRDLWPEVIRIITEMRRQPAYVLIENVAGFVKMELDRSISDLESEGYTVRPFIISACATDAKHRRDRVWIVAHAEGNGNRGKQFEAGCEVTPDPDQPRPQGHRRLQECADERIVGQNGETIKSIGKPEPSLGVLASGLPSGLAGWCQWPEEPAEVPRVAVGVKGRVNKLKALGNSIVPQVAFELIRAIAQIELAFAEAGGIRVRLVKNPATNITPSVPCALSRNTKSGETRKWTESVRECGK